MNRPFWAGHVTLRPTPAGTRVPDIFLSYSREDQDRAKVFAEAFSAQGFDVWWDVGLRTGEAYDKVTEDALRAAKAVVVLWSKRSVESRWVRAEATLADRHGTLLPVMIEPCERPIMFELTQTAELSHWQGDAGDRAWVALLGDVKRFVAKKGPSPAVEAPTTPVAAPTVQETLKPGQSGSVPSLAVLPFTNRSNVPEDEVFAEGMVEDVIWALSQGVNVRVLGAMATSNLIRNMRADPAALGRQLGVHYLLEGNVRRVGTNLRVTTQLLEAATGAVQWAARFDRPLTELAELQEELVTDSAASLDTQVYALEMERALKKPGDLTAWEALMRSFGALRTWNWASAMDEAKRAVAIAPDYDPAYAMLAAIQADANIFVSDDLTEVQRIRSLADRALFLNPENAFVLGWVGFALAYLGYPDEAVRHSGKAVRKTPGSGYAHFTHGVACCLKDDAQTALPHLEAAVRLSPGWPVLWGIHHWRCVSFVRLERWPEALDAINASIESLPSNGLLYLWAGLCSSRLGDEPAAQRHIATARRLGWPPSQMETVFRRFLMNAASRDEEIARVHHLYATTEAGA